MNVIKLFKIINKNKTLNKQEKKELKRKGLIEYIVNFYKKLLKFPFQCVGVTLCLIGELFSILEKVIEFIQKPFYFITEWLEDTLPELNITRGKARNEIIKQITKEQNKKIKEEDLL